MSLTIHCIVTTYDGEVSISMGWDLDELIRDIAKNELDGLEVQTLDELEQMLNERDTDMNYTSMEAPSALRGD